MKIVFSSRGAAVAILLATSIFTTNASAAGSHSGGHGEQIGQPGGSSGNARTIQVTMADSYFQPEAITVEPGETIRFVVRNAGELVHEFNIGTAEMHRAHAPEMMMLVEHGVLEADRINHKAAKAMKESMGHGLHAEGNSVMLEPGKTGELVWKFPQGGRLEFACNVPGHYDAGMVGEFRGLH